MSMFMGEIIVFITMAFLRPVLEISIKDIY